MVKKSWKKKFFFLVGKRLKLRFFLVEKVEKKFFLMVEKS